MGDWKTRLSILWVIHAVSIMSLLLLNLFETGDLTHIVPPLPVDSGSLLLVAVAILVQLAMAFLSQVLADKMNRWSNIVVGAVYSIGAIVAMVMMLMGNPSVLAILFVAGLVFGVLTVWTAWKSEQKA